MNPNPLNPDLPRGSQRARWPLYLATLPPLLALAACSLAPAQAVPPLELPAQWKAQPAAASAVAAPADWISTEAASQALAQWQTGQWWLLFDDAPLAELIAQIDISNQNLAQAAANVAQAEALLRQQRAQLWPAVGATASGNRAGGQGDVPVTHSGAIGLTASWAPDLWGKLGDAARAQGASVQASQADLAAARLSAQGSLAQTYFALRENDAEIALIDSIITGYERSAAITLNRYNAGLTARTDTLQAQSTLDNARASRVALQRTRALNEHAIALLTGRAPASLAIAPAPWMDTVPPIPTGVPATLLLRRPDVAAAERAVVAANARIGVARSAFFPQITLTGGISASGASLPEAISSPTMLWSLGLAIAQFVFDAGQRDAAVDQAIAAHAAATATYRQAALAAMKNVEDQLVSLQTLAAQIERSRASADAATRIEQQMMNRYQAGLAAYTEVVTAQ
ncbi:MAG: efflux transporter outer membrane subunit, partial [Burkholderiaceae bacterium]|nr:efflux transporter outer membrane subunit [Burkholderiaceae bacterium]